MDTKPTGSKPIHPACLPTDQLLANCQIQRGRRGGPGGQNRNKVETAIVIEHLASGVQSQSHRLRTQAANQEAAIFQLRCQLAIEVRGTGDDLPATCQQLWERRVRNGRIALSSSHEDFPCMLAIAMDRLAMENWQPAPAATALQITTSQLIKMIRSHPAAFQFLNQQRANCNLPPLQ
jgi:hypothetical protein